MIMDALIVTSLLSLSSIVTPVMMMETSDIKVVFPAPQKKGRYIKYSKSLPDLKEFTLCYWVKPYSVESGRGHVFSYSTPKEPDTILTWVDKSKTSDLGLDFGLDIGGHTYVSKVTKFNKMIGTWTHVCHGWSSYRNGYITINGCDFVHSSKKSSNDSNLPLGTVKSGGVIILGQDQDAYGGGFVAEDAFHGELFDVQMWDEMMSRELVYLVRNCQKTKIEGNVLRWMHDAMEMRDVHIQQSFVCSLSFPFEYDKTSYKCPW